MKLITQCFAIAVVLLICRVVSAESPNSANQAKAEHEQDIAKMKVKDPKGYDRLYKQGLVNTKMLLGRLGYDVGPFDLALDSRVTAAIKSYERNRGIPITGNPLAFETFLQVSKDLTLVNTSHAYPGSFSFSDLFWDAGTVIAQGTWIIVGDSQAEPEQNTRIYCERAHGKCYASSAIKGGGDASYIRSDLDIYHIARWDNVEIVSEPLDFTCARYVLRINRLQKSVTGTRSKISNSNDCKALGNSELTLKLANGDDVFKELRLKYRSDLLGLLQLSPEARSILAE